MSSRECKIIKLCGYLSQEDFDPGSEQTRVDVLCFTMTRGGQTMDHQSQSQGESWSLNTQTTSLTK